MSDDHRPDPDQTEMSGPENDALEAEAATEAAASDTAEQADGDEAERSEAAPDDESEDEGEDESDSQSKGETEDEGEEADVAPEPAGKQERLQKILAQAGIASRRHAEELITEGRVQVNGKVVTELGTKADAVRDHIRVDGKLLQGSERQRYFMLNKPKGFVTTVSDPEHRPTVMEFFNKTKERVYPVGRLDYLSEGLLLMTNDGDLANKLTRAASGVEKTYLVKVSGEPSEEAIERLRTGVGIDREKPGSGRVQTAAAQIRQVRRGDNPWYEVVLIEGRNRELRKMFEEIGHHVEKIRRVGYGPLVLDMEPGKFRELAPDELEDLRKAADGTLRKPKKESRKRSSAAEAQLPTLKPRWTPKFPDARGGRTAFRRPEAKPEALPEAGAASTPFRAPGRPSADRGPGFSAGKRPGAGSGRPPARAGRPGFGADRGEARGPSRASSRGDVRKEGPPFRRPERGAADDRPRGPERSDFRSQPRGEFRPSPPFGEGRPPRPARSNAPGRPYTPNTGRAAGGFSQGPPRDRGSKPAWKSKPGGPDRGPDRGPERGSRPPRFDRPSQGPGGGRPAGGARPDRGSRPARFGGADRPAPRAFRPRANEDAGDQGLELPSGPKKRLEIRAAEDDFKGRESRPAEQTERRPFTPRSGPRAGGPRAGGPRAGGPRPQFDRGSRPPSAARPQSDREERPRFDRPKPAGPGAPRREFSGAKRPGAPAGRSFGAGASSGTRPGGRPAGKPGGRPGGKPGGRPGSGGKSAGKAGGRPAGKSGGKRFGGKPGGGKKRG